MIVSLDWLNDFVEIQESPGELSDILSNVGLEAEIVDMPTSIPGVIICKVESAEKHPDADKLKVCKVNDGKKIHKVVCGASNIDSGQTIAFATIGTILPGNIKIKKANIRGVESSGMICSERELRISDEHEGIMVLPNDLVAGDDFMKSYGYKFLSIELDITPNRPDAFSHLGVARDIACVKNRIFNPLSIKENKIDSEFEINITMENHDDCPRYIGAVFSNIKVGPSPQWLVDRLKSVGQRSINNIVDISNFVLMEIGHPTHIFDYDKLKNKEIHVRRAKKGETLTTLDELNHKLDTRNLLITDGKSPIALAGVMGGKETAVSSSTSTILIESAYFNPVTIRKSAKSLFISTDASKRYERGADPNGCHIGFWRVISLLREIAGGDFISSINDFYPKVIKQKIVNLSKSELDSVLGISINKEKINKIFTNLGFETTFKNNIWKCKIPLYRPDITRSVDLIEEVARINGYNSIPSDLTLQGPFRFNDIDPEKYLNKLRQNIVSYGFHQIYTNSLQSNFEASLSGKIPIKMINPLSVDMSTLRTSLLPGLLKASNLNIKHGTKDLRIFELGHVHTKENEGLEGVKEHKYISGLIMGELENVSVHSKGTKEDLFSLKGILTSLFINKLKMRLELLDGDFHEFEYSKTIMINRQTVGAMGKISETLIDSLGLDIDDIYGFEINLEPIKSMLNTQRVFRPIVPYPKVYRDINLVMPKNQEVGDLINSFHKQGKKLLANAKPVNIFIDEDSIGSDLKSVTFTMEFQSSSKTLEDKDVNPVIDEIIRVAEKDFFAKLRT